MLGKQIMDAAKSKFEYGRFLSGHYHFAVNAGKFTKEEAIKIYRDDYDDYDYPESPFIVEGSYVKWHAGINEDGMPCGGWWFDYSPTEDKRSVKVWAFRRAKDGEKGEGND